MSEELYYIQNVGYCGNCLIWWRDGGHGYTCNLASAWKVPKEKALAICQDRPEQDIMWLCSDIDNIAVRHVDTESARFKELRERKRGNVR
jgi:hypothetical protein